MLRTSRPIAACFKRPLVSSTPILAPYKLSFCSCLRIIKFPSSPSSLCFVKPSTFQAENTKPTMLINYSDCCINASKGKKLEFECIKLPLKDFCTFIETEPKSVVIAFFREAAMELESKRKIMDFHMRVVNHEESFKVEVFYGVKKFGPPVLSPSNCISCYPNASLFPGQEPTVEARECVLEEFSNHPHAMCRLDAKGRYGFIITPIRHVDRMSELDDDELFGLWCLAVRVLREANLPFTSMILNHGSYRNVEHLHLKVWVDKNLYEQYCTQWSNERQDLWRRLQDLASKRPRKKLPSKKL